MGREGGALSSGLPLLEKGLWSRRGEKYVRGEKDSGLVFRQKSRSTQVLGDREKKKKVRQEGGRKGKKGKRIAEEGECCEGRNVSPAKRKERMTSLSSEGRRERGLGTILS